MPTGLEKDEKEELHFHDTLGPRACSPLIELDLHHREALSRGLVGS